MKSCFLLKYLVLSLCLSSYLYGQSNSAFKKNELSLGTSNFPFYLINPNNQTFTDKSVILTYTYFIRPKTGLKVGVECDKRPLFTNDNNSNKKRFDWGLNMGIIQNLLTLKDWKLGVGADLIYQNIDIRTKDNYQNIIETWEEKRFTVGPSIELSYEFNNRFSIKSETGISYGHILSKQHHEKNDLIVINNSYGFNFYRILSLELNLKF